MVQISNLLFPNPGKSNRKSEEQLFLQRGQVTNMTCADLSQDLREPFATAVRAHSKSAFEIRSLTRKRWVFERRSHTTRTSARSNSQASLPSGWVQNHFVLLNWIKYEPILSAAQILKLKQKSPHVGTNKHQQQLQIARGVGKCDHVIKRVLNYRTCWHSLIPVDPSYHYVMNQEPGLHRVRGLRRLRSESLGPLFRIFQCTLPEDVPPGSSCGQRQSAR